jgi:hypothetical protein
MHRPHPDLVTTQEVLMMRRIHKRLVAGAVGLAVLIPAGLAVAQTPPTDPDPVCTEEQRQERWAARDELSAQIRDQLEQEGVTDPDQFRDQLRSRLHDAMEDRFGEVNGPHAGGGMRHSDGGHHLGPMDGTGNGRGANR